MHIISLSKDLMSNYGFYVYFDLSIDVRFFFLHCNSMMRDISENQLSQVEPGD